MERGNSVLCCAHIFIIVVLQSIAHEHMDNSGASS